MDLRQFRPTQEQVERAAQLLRYQPFIIDENRHTGVAYTWLYSPDPTSVSPADFFFDREKVTEDVWNQASDANRRLASTYETLIARVVEACPRGGSYLDVGCNTGYFPVRASLAGIRTAVGIDQGDYASAVHLLNEITGSSAKFSTGSYDSTTHHFNNQEDLGFHRYDVVSCSALLCHVSDPLHFLRALSHLASGAILIWSGFLESDELLIRYNPPNKFSEADFPNGFDDGTSLSVGLLFLAMTKLGFAFREEIKFTPSCLDENWHLRRIPQYQKFRAFLFWR